MRGDFFIPYVLAQKQARLGLYALGCLVLFGALGIVFLSPGLVVALTLAILIVCIAFVRPQAVLFGLLAYLPFEPFLLKWVPDSIYLFARYGSEMVVYL